MIQSSLLRAVCVATIGLAHTIMPQANAASQIIGWGDNSIGETTVPADFTNGVAISAGGGHSAVLNADGTVSAFGYGAYGQLLVPAGLANVVGVSAGYDHILAVRNDGTVVAWGRDDNGQTDVPTGLNNVVAVSANEYYSLALKADGTVVAWGHNGDGQTSVPAGLNNVIAISAGGFHALALKSDGTVVGWGRNNHGQTDTPANLTDVAAISAGGEHSLALKKDGTVVAWGSDNYSQSTVPPTLGRVIAIAAGDAHNLVLQDDGTVVAWGWNDNGQTNTPAGLSKVRAISAGFAFSLALVREQDDSQPPTITCPPNVHLSCTNCDTDPLVTGAATATGNAPISISYNDSVSGDCPKVVTRTWTATDANLLSSSCVQTITCAGQDTQSPTITCPKDVILFCASCDTDPRATGIATATDDSPVSITYSDSVWGTCPKVVKRTWTAVDGAGNSASCVQTITCMPPSLVTDSSQCIFDRDHSTPVQDFRLLFMLDPQAYPCFRLTASNPGQFSYNVFATGSPGQRLTFHLTLPYPFVTQGATPFHAYDWATVVPDHDHFCLEPGNKIFSGSGHVSLSTYGGGLSTTVSVTVTVPESGVVFLATHLDYGLKGHSGFTKNVNDDAVDCATGAQVLVPNHGLYSFTVTGDQNDTIAIENDNEFKRNPGVAGLVRSKTTLDPVPGTLVNLINSRGVVVASDATDEDGFYLMVYKHTGKAAKYRVAIATPDGYNETKTITLKANGFVQLDFWAP